jgi:nickel transport protein
MKLISITTRRWPALAALTAALCSALPATAHEIWFAQRSNKLALIYGAGAEDLDMVKRLPKVTATLGLDAAGSPLKAELKATDSLVIVDAPAELATIAAVMDYGLWSKTPDGKFHNKGRDEVPNAVTSSHNFKYATHLRKHPTGALAPVPGVKFQVVPVGKTFPKKMGETLVVEVLLDGKPAAGAKVFQDAVTNPGGKPVVTGNNGRATLKVRNGGLNVVLAELESGPENPAVTMSTQHVATLSFMYDPPAE